MMRITLTNTHIPIGVAYLLNNNNCVNKRINIYLYNVHHLITRFWGERVPTPGRPILQAYKSYFNSMNSIGNNIIISRENSDNSKCISRHKLIPR